MHSNKGFVCSDNYHRIELSFTWEVQVHTGSVLKYFSIVVIEGGFCSVC